jgi:hypothetical protein
MQSDDFSWDDFSSTERTTAAASSLGKTWRTLHTRRRPARCSRRHAGRHATTHSWRRSHSCARSKKRDRNQTQGHNKAKAISMGRKGDLDRGKQVSTRRRWRHSWRTARRRSATSHHSGRRSAATDGGRRHDTGARTTHSTRRAS